MWDSPRGSSGRKQGPTTTTKATAATRRAAAATTNKEEEERIKREGEDANNRRNRRSSRKRRPSAKNIVAVSSKNGIRLYNPLPYLVNIQTPAVAPPPPRGSRSGDAPSVPCALLTAINGTRSFFCACRQTILLRAPLTRRASRLIPSASNIYRGRGCEWRMLLLGLTAAIQPFRHHHC